MKKIFYLIICISFLFCYYAYAQHNHAVVGVVRDSSKAPLQGCTVKVQYDNGDSAVTTSRADGKFIFKNVPGVKITVTASMVGYDAVRKHYVLNTDSALELIGAIVLEPVAHNLDSVSVNSEAPITIKEDTVSYSASAYPVRDNAMLEDILEKLPGVDIDANGNVTAQGKQVIKARVNGKDFFGGDVKTAIQNIPANVIDKVQMIDDYGDQAKLTGVKTGEPDKVMNITIRADKNHGYTGQVTFGEGEDALPQHPGVTNDNRYAALVSGFRFNGNEQLSVLGNVNNANLSTFSFGSPASSGLDAKKVALDGLMSGKINLSGMNVSTGGANQPNQQNGITTTHTAGFNYSDQWGKALSVNGSYSFADNTVVTQTTTFQQNTSPVNPGFSNDSSHSSNRNINHRFDWNMEYKPDTINYLRVIPRFSYSSSDGNSTENVVSNRNGGIDEAYNTIVSSNLHNPNFGFTAIFNHRFKKRVRSFDITLTMSDATINQFQNPVYNYTVGVATVPPNQMIYTYSHTQNYGVNFSWLEPVNGDGYLQFTYAPNVSITNNNKQTNALDSSSHFYLPDTALSNRYNYVFTTNRFGVNYRSGKKDFNYTLGIGVEPSTLSGNSPLANAETHTTTWNFSPTAHFVYDFGKGKSFSANYDGNSSQPGFIQLQPVTDYSNALYPVEGNPNLRPSYASNLSVRYNQFTSSTGASLFTGFYFSQTENAVVTNTVSYPKNYTPNPLLDNAYLTKYLNANGFYTASANISYSKPWDNRRYTLSFSGRIIYYNNVGYLTNVDSTTYAQTTQKNIARNFMVTPGIRFRLYIPDIIDGQFNTNYSINATNNSVNNSFTEATANVRTLSLSLNFKHYILKDWTLSYDYSKAYNYGYAIPVPNPNILNAWIERRFLKNHRGTLRLAAYDLFNQNTGYSSGTTASAVTQTVTNRLGRYYLLTFTLRLEKFAAMRSDTK